MKRRPGKLFSTTPGTVPVFAIPRIIGPTTSDQTLIGTAYVNVAGLGVSISPGTYFFHFYVVCDTDATTTGIDLAVNGPANDYIYYTQFGFGSATASLARVMTTFDQNTANISCAGTTRQIYEVYGMIKATAAGTLVPRIKREAVGTGPNVRAGCVGFLTPTA